MVVMAFVGSVAVVGAIASLVPVTTGSTQSGYADYHYVPAAGDAFGA